MARVKNATHPVPQDRDAYERVDKITAAKKIKKSKSRAVVPVQKVADVYKPEAPFVRINLMKEDRDIFMRKFEVRKASEAKILKTKKVAVRVEKEAGRRRAKRVNVSTLSPGNMYSPVNVNLQEFHNSMTLAYVSAVSRQNVYKFRPSFDRSPLHGGHESLPYYSDDEAMSDDEATSDDEARALVPNPSTNCDAKLFGEERFVDVESLSENEQSDADSASSSSTDNNSRRRWDNKCVRNESSTIAKYFAKYFGPPYCSRTNYYVHADPQRCNRNLALWAAATRESCRHGAKEHGSREQPSSSLNVDDVSSLKEQQIKIIEDGLWSIEVDGLHTFEELLKMTLMKGSESPTPVPDDDFHWECVAAVLATEGIDLDAESDACREMDVDTGTDTKNDSVYNVIDTCTDTENYSVYNVVDTCAVTENESVNNVIETCTDAKNDSVYNTVDASAAQSSICNSTEDDEYFPANLLSLIIAPSPPCIPSTSSCHSLRYSPLSASKKRLTVINGNGSKSYVALPIRNHQSSVLAFQKFSATQSKLPPPSDNADVIVID